MPADEFDIIRDLFAPLATSSSARGLTDDVTVLETNGQLVVTTDAIVEGVHFLSDDPIETVAKKALRVNLSDLTAKGAKCVGVLLTLIWPTSRPSAQIAEFARGLGEDLKRFDIPLLGGDTTSTDGPLTVSITAFGAPLGARVPARGDARVGQQLWITGSVGEGFLGLRSLRQAPSVLGASAEDQSDAGVIGARDCYRVPRPPMQFAEIVARYAAAAMDVSDGLVGDAAKIAAASNVALRIDAEAIPLSSAGHAYVSKHGAKGLAEIITAGDDYQVLFTAAPEHRGQILAAARETETNVALIGDVEAGAGVRVVGAGGVALDIASMSHVHKLGR